MKKMIKATGIIIASIMVIGILAGSIAIGVGATRYMTNQHFSFSNAITWAWDDLMAGFEDIFQAKAEDVIVFGPTNEYIDVIACTAL